jgi:hypothetical protein
MPAQLELIYADPNRPPQFERVGIGDGVEQPNPCYIGSGPASTIQVDDLRVLDPHLMLTGDEDGNFELYAFDLNQVLIDSQPLRQKSVRLKPWSEVRLGQCVFYLNPDADTGTPPADARSKEPDRAESVVTFENVVPSRFTDSSGRHGWRYDFGVKYLRSEGNPGVDLSVRLVSLQDDLLSDKPSDFIDYKFDNPSFSLAADKPPRRVILSVLPRLPSKLRAGTHWIQIEATLDPPVETPQLSKELEFEVEPVHRFHLSDLQPPSHWLRHDLPFFRSEARSTLRIFNDGNSDDLYLIASHNEPGSDCAVRLLSKNEDESDGRGATAEKVTRKRRSRMTAATPASSLASKTTLEPRDASTPPGWESSVDSWENFLVRSGKSREVTIAVSPRSRPPISLRRARQQVRVTVGPIVDPSGPAAQSRTLRLTVSPSVLGPLRIALVALMILAALIVSVFDLNYATTLTATAIPNRVRVFSSISDYRIRIGSQQRNQQLTASGAAPDTTLFVPPSSASALTLVVSGSDGMYDLLRGSQSSTALLTFANLPLTATLQLTLTSDADRLTNLLVTPTLKTGHTIDVNLRAPVTLTVISNPGPKVEKDGWIEKTNGPLTITREYDMQLSWACGLVCTQAKLEKTLVTGVTEGVSLTLGSKSFGFIPDNSARYRLTTGHPLSQIFPWPPFVAQREIEVRLSDDAKPSGVWGVQPASAPEGGKVTVFWDKVDRAKKLIVYAEGVPNVIAEKDIPVGKWETTLSADTTFSVTASNNDAIDVLLRTAAGVTTTTVTLVLPPPPPSPPPQIARFEITPTEVLSGERVLIEWQVTGDPDVMTVTLTSDGIKTIVPASGFIYQRPDSTGDVLRIFQLVADNGVTSVMAVKQVNVKFSPPTPTPVPTATPGPVGKPNYDVFCGGEGRSDLVQGTWEWVCKSDPGKVITHEACQERWGKTAFARAEDRTQKGSWECWK